jgi:hypothetical protein
MVKIQIQISDRDRNIADKMRIADELRGQRFTMKHYYQLIFHAGADACAERENVKRLLNNEI